MDESDSDGTPLETFALQMRAEQMVLLSRTKAGREGESDRLEVGAGGASDIVVGTETLKVGGSLSERARGESRITQASRLETTVDGKMGLRAFSDTTMMAGAMTDVQVGMMLTLAGMSDDLVIGGGMRLTLADLWACGLMGMEENPLSVHADAVFIEGYRTHFEREYGAGIHMIGAATFSGALHTTMATGFRALGTVAFGVRNMSPAGGSADAGSQAGAPVAPPPPPVDPPQPSNNSQVLTAADDANTVDEIANVDEAAQAAQTLEVQSIDNVSDSATALDELGSADPNPPPNYPAPPPPDEYDHLGYFRRGTGLPEDAHEYADLTIYAAPDSVVAVTGDGKQIDFDDIIPGWLENSFDYGEYAPPVPAHDYETPIGVKLPADFNYLDEFENFRATLQADYRGQMVPGLEVMQTALNRTGELPWQHLRTMDPQWLADAGINSDELARLRLNAADAYQKILDMEAVARRTGNLEKADALRKALQDIDTSAFVIWQNALKEAEAVRPTGFLPLPSNVLFDSVLEDLQAGFADVQRRKDAADFEDVELLRRLSLEGSFYDHIMHVIRQGYDPTPYLIELSKSTILSLGDDTDTIALVHRWREDIFVILGDTKHLINAELPPGFFFDPGAVVFAPVDVSDNWRQLRGIPDDFDFTRYRNYLANLNLDDATQLQVDEVNKALDNIDDGPLAQLAALQSLAHTDENGVTRNFIDDLDKRAEIHEVLQGGDPVDAYRMLEELESYFIVRSGALRNSDTANAADLAKADHIRSIIDSIDAMVVDEYNKIYDLLSDIVDTNAANPPIPLTFGLLPSSAADDVDEVENIVQTESIYPLLGNRQLDSDDAATFDDVQAGLDLRANQVDIERSLVEDPVFVTARGADSDLDEVVVTIGRLDDGDWDDIFPNTPVDAIEEAAGDIYRVGNIDPGDVEVVDEPIYGDFTFRDHRRTFSHREIQPDADKYKLMTHEEWLEAVRSKHRRATAEDWTAVLRRQVDFAVDVEDDPLRFAADPPPAQALDDPNNGPPGHVWDEDLRQWVPAPADDPPPPNDAAVDDAYRLLGESDPPPGSVWDPETNAWVVPPEETAQGGPFAPYNADLVDNPADTTMPGDDIYEITRRRIEIAEEGTYNTLVFGFQKQAPDSIYARLDELKMSDDFTDAARASYTNVDYDSGRAILTDSLGSTEDLVNAPVVQPAGLDRPAAIKLQFEGDIIITRVDFAGEATDALPPVSVTPNDNTYQLLSPVLTSEIDQAVGPAIRRRDGSFAVIEDIWESTDPLTTVVNRELHRVVPDTFESVDKAASLPRVHETVNAYVNVTQSGGAVFNLAQLNDLDEIVMFNEVPWQVAADPLLSPDLHQMSARGDDVLSSVLNRGGFGMRPGSALW